RVFALEPGDRVLPGDRLRFIPRLPAGSRARYALVGSVDGAGRFSQFYPAEPAESSVPLPPTGQPLPGSILLDRAEGPERIFAIYSEKPLSIQRVRRSVQAAAHTPNTLALPADVDGEVVWFVLKKDPDPRDTLP